MKPFFVIALTLVTTALATSCSQSGAAAPAKAVAPAKVAAFTKDFDTWYHYTYYHLLLSRDFQARDTLGQPLAKRAFLDQLATGKVLALVNGTDQQLPIYQLCAFPAGHDPAIRATSQQLAAEALSSYKREGQVLPDFNFVDLNGVTYTKASTKGKLVVLKFWYIGCVACVEEFPAINAQVAKYQRSDVLFVSLAMNKPQDLRKFLQDREVKFAVVPTSKAYLVDTLQVLQYPTHFILGRDGKIVKATTRASDLAVALQKAVQGP
ncbi:TlpA family protein disulfide reductase [Hymenobacter setariae]|nr:TlpA disulfide reductase family protein [Hymenobacter setariae]